MKIKTHIRILLSLCVAMTLLLTACGNKAPAPAPEEPSSSQEDPASVPDRPFPSSFSMTIVSAIDVMCEPRGILFLSDGSFLLSDSYNKLIWQVLDGQSSTFAGGETVSDPYDRPLGGYNDASLLDSHFKLPWAISPFLDGFAVSDADNDAVRLIRSDNIQTVNAIDADNIASTLQVSFQHPTGLASDPDGFLFVSDTYAGAVRQVSPDGDVSTLADGLDEPMGLCWKDGSLYIAETGANRIMKLSGGQLTLVAGSGQEGFADGPADQAAFFAPQGVAVADDGTVYVADTANGAVRVVRQGSVSTIAQRDPGDITAFIPNSPVGLALRGDDIYVCDSFARKVFILSPEG